MKTFVSRNTARTKKRSPIVSLPIQRKARVSDSGDGAEQEADRFADHMLAGGNRKTDRLPTIREAPTAKTPVSGSTVARLNGFRGGGQALAREDRRFFEPRLRLSLKHVRIHTGAEAARVSRSLGARAFTLGNDIVFGAREYQPGSHSGRRLLAHELTHVAQQSKSPGGGGGQSSAPQAARGPVNGGVVQREESKKGKKPNQSEEVKNRSERALMNAQTILERLVQEQSRSGISAERKTTLRMAIERIRVSMAGLLNQMEKSRDGGASGVEVAASFALAGALVLTPLPVVDEAVGTLVAIVQSVRWLLTILRVIGTSLIVTAALVQAVISLEQAVRGGTVVLSKGGVQNVADSGLLREVIDIIIESGEKDTKERRCEVARKLKQKEEGKPKREKKQDRLQKLKALVKFLCRGPRG